MGRTKAASTIRSLFAGWMGPTTRKCRDGRETGARGRCRKVHRFKKGRAGLHIGSPARSSWLVLGLLLADERAVDVDVVQHDHAGAGFRPAVENKVDALHPAARSDGR